MNNYYVDNEIILKELKELKKTGQMSDELGKIILKIMKELSSKGNFCGYTWKDDMVSEGVLTCVKYLKNFDVEKSNNAFSYITKIGYMSFVAYIKKQKKHCDIKKTCYEFYNGNMEPDYNKEAIDYQDIQHIKQSIE